eukprot:scaffold3430_cov162-Amphora_coffeaeformis.AAC.3
MPELAAWPYPALHVGGKFNGSFRMPSVVRLLMKQDYTECTHVYHNGYHNGVVLAWSSGAYCTVLVRSLLFDQVLVTYNRDICGCDMSAP